MSEDPKTNEAVPSEGQDYDEYAEGGEEEYYEEGDDAQAGTEALQKSVEEMDEELKQLSNLHQQISDQLTSTQEKLEENSM